MHRAVFKDHIEQLWGSWDEDWQRNNFWKECAESTCDVIIRDAAVVGYVQHVIEPTSLRVWNIALWPDFRGQGIGTQIIRDFQQLARDRDAELTLRVFPTNLAAQRLYRRLGFREIERTSRAIELAWRA